MANTAVVPTICAVDETRDNTTVDTSTSAPATSNKLTTPKLGLAQSDSSNFVRHLPMARLSPDIAQIISIMEGQHTVSLQHTSVTMAGLLQQMAA